MIPSHCPDEHEDNCACAAEILRPAAAFGGEDDCACIADSLQTGWRPAPDTFIQPLNEEKFLLANPAHPGSVLVLDRREMALFSALLAPRPNDDCAPALQTTDCAPPFSSEQARSLARHWLRRGLLTRAEDHCACASTDPTCRSVQPVGLTAWLHLTDRCNLRCDYCYLPHKRDDMSLATGQAAIEATFRSALANGFEQVKFKYAGGEPLLRFPLIVELHQHAQSLAERHGLALEGVVLSNGTLLTPEMAQTLSAIDLRLMISLDGLGAYHDAHRRYAGGRGSFADVADAVDLALAHGLAPSISVTVSSRTAEGLPEVMAWILERDLPFSLNFYRENPLSASHADLRLDEEKIIAGMLAAFKVIENNLPRRPFLGGIIDRANLSISHVHTCGVGQNYLVFDPYGRVAKCQMHLGRPLTDAAAADPLALLRADRLGVQNVSVEEKEGCRECRWRYWCAGGCPLEAFRATGRYDVKSPNCHIYQALFPEALRLEGLRLLKYQDDPAVVEKIVV
ncbi:MAG: radical SAM protein [Anaerolineales bacterium]